MAFKRALIVDDSKSARVALKRLLEEHRLVVHFAESGEAALDFLTRQSVDVIFMDHEMPGMDGLEAVSAIKKNPDTAMIPVMMYTAREGEVYVGQARALGAVGVLPKQVQPGVLFDTLLELGLVRDRRAPQSAEPEDADEAAARARGLDRAEKELDRALNQQAIGMSVQALVSRILQDQHAELRLDILKSHQDFANRVAAEIYARQKEEQQENALEAPVEFPPQPRWGLRLAAAVALLLPAIALAGLYWQARAERDAARADNARLVAAAERRLAAEESRSASLISSIDQAQIRAQARYAGLLNALEWAVNQDSQVPYDEIAFGDERLTELRELVDQLAGIGFRGTVRLEAHLGEFCLAEDEAGGYVLAAPDLPVAECAFMGHEREFTISTGDEQSVGFANFVSSSPLVNDLGIEIEVAALGREDSIRRFPYPPTVETAGEWNAIAARNNRVEFSLLPAG
jgi:CheY-like chemotaxis protein